MKRTDFLSCLRVMTRNKILSIKEAKGIFTKRVNGLIRAQQYELKSQASFGMTAAHRVFATQAEQVRQLFEGESRDLSAEYRTIYDLIRFYQKQLRKQASQLATQECIISKLSNHVATGMHGRLHDRIQKKEALAINPILDDDEFHAEIFTKGATETRFHDPLKSALYRQQFDLYGGSFRL